MNASQSAPSGAEPSGGVAVFVGGVRLLIALAVAFTALVGLQSGLACQYDWSVIGASILMLAWAARWLLSAAPLVLRTAAGRLRRTANLVHAVGLAAAALLFAGHSLTEPLWPFGWWPLAVGVLLAAVTVVYARDFARSSGVID
jgi:hypothetical protein